MSIRKVGLTVHTPIGYFCLMPEDVVGTYVLTKHPDSLVSEVRNAVKAMGCRGRALVVGAHIGTIAVPLSGHCSELVAMEPNPRAFELLELNAAMNGRENMLLVNAAAAEEEGHLKFIVRYENSGGSGRAPVVDGEHWHEGKTDQIVVPGVRLDDTLSGQFDLVFMDCEGSEYFAALGAQRILAEARAFIFEFIPEHVLEVSGVSLKQFLQPIASHFDTMFVPSTGRSGTRADFLPILQEIANAGKSDAGIILRKR